MPCRPESDQRQSCPHMSDPARPRCSVRQGTLATASKNEPFCFRYSPAWPRRGWVPYVKRNRHIDPILKGRGHPVSPIASPAPALMRQPREHEAIVGGSF